MPTMATNLYETLGVGRDATAEQIRKAYKKRALQTHPDRLPQGATPEDKAASEEQFRRVNNAYEVLNDSQNRRIYDLHGVWPPPEPPTFDERPRRHSHRHEPYGRRHPVYNDPFAHPLFASSSTFAFPAPPPPPFSRPRQADFGFTDPFALFDSIFGDMHRGFDSFHNDPFFAQPGAAFPPQEHRRQHRSMGQEFTPFPFGGGISMQMPNGMSHSQTFQSESRGFRDGGRGHGRWTSEQRVTKTVNGLTESVWSRTDSNGNKHVTRTYPDGRERYTINGVEQPSNDRFIPPPPYPGIQNPTIARQDYASPPPPHVYDAPYNPDPVYPDPERDHHRGDSKKRWWRGRW